ncbi:hypothetical protein X734_30585 [Mesorhizobium sp. L2C084A000]|nr:hypothetical protein X734_30585 [Mesorhizobium sp. L2C084A000]
MPDGEHVIAEERFFLIRADSSTAEREFICESS